MSYDMSDQDEAIAIVIDTSSSAAAGLDAAREAAQIIHGMFGSEFKFFMLGNAAPVPPAALKQAGPPGAGNHAQACSLIAPIMEALVREERKHSVVIIGNGEIFDLDDWTDDPRLDGWLLVRTGGQSLQGPSHRIAEIELNQITGDADTLLTYFSRHARDAEGAGEAAPGAYDAGAYEWKIDATGYPLVYVEPLGAFVHLFPVSKPQFEKFVAAGRRSEFGDEWYAEILALNPRASYRNDEIPAREQLFMTAVTPEESAAFARWLGRGYALMTAEEWNKCYGWLGERPAPSPPPDLASRLSRDALALWGIVEAQWLDHRRRSTLRELALMTRGVALEWALERPGRYCGLGEPAASKYQRKANEPVRPLARRPKDFGFRLIVR